MTSLRDDDVLVLAGAMSLTDDDMFLSPSPPPSLERLRRGLDRLAHPGWGRNLVTGKELGMNTDKVEILN